MSLAFSADQMQFNRDSVNDNFKMMGMSMVEPGGPKENGLINNERPKSGGTQSQANEETCCFCFKKAGKVQEPNQALLGSN